MIHIHHTYKTSLESSPLQINRHKSFGYFMPHNNKVIADMLTFSQPCGIQ